MAFQSFEELDVWKRGCQQAVVVCQAMMTCQNYAFRDQMQRAALSVPSNIAEGSERDSRQDFIRFLRISKGSNAELRTQTYIAAKLGLIDIEQSRLLISESKEISAMLQGLVRALQQSARPSEN